MDRTPLGRALRPLAMALLAGAAWSAAAQEQASPPGATPAPGAAVGGAGDPPAEAPAPSADEAPEAAAAVSPPEAQPGSPAETPGSPTTDEAPAAAAATPPAATPASPSADETPAAATAVAPAEAPTAPSADETPPAAAAAAPAPEAGLGPDEVGRRVAEAYGVELLRVREVEADGRPAYAVTVMLPGGNRNNALQVVTVLADPATGDVLPIFRHLPAGIAGNPGLEAETSTEAGIQAMRRQTFR